MPALLKLQLRLWLKFHKLYNKTGQRLAIVWALRLIWINF